MPASKGIQGFPTGAKFPDRLDVGQDQRPFQTPVKTSKGPQVFKQGSTLANAGESNDGQLGHIPKPISSKGPQTQQSTRFGNEPVTDSSKPLNP